MAESRRDDPGVEGAAARQQPAEPPVALLTMSGVDNHPGLEEQMFLHAAQAMQLVRELPKYAAKDPQVPLPGTVWVACLESFFMNVRLVAEFLTLQKSRDEFRAADFHNQWRPMGKLGPLATADTFVAAGRLQAYRGLASEHVAHLSKNRFMGPSDDVEDTTLVGLTRIARDCDTVWAAFAPLTGYAVAGPL
jgi:hypothetical protein